MPRSIRGCAMTDIVTATPEAAMNVKAPKGRSLWATAMMRLRRNKAAMASLVILVVYVFAGIFGPMLAPHDYAAVYTDYVKVPASPEAYRREYEIRPAAESVMQRARLSVDDIELDGNTLRVEASSASEIDPRVTRYLDRSDLFSNARITEQSADKKRV